MYVCTAEDIDDIDVRTRKRRNGIAARFVKAERLLRGSRAFGPDIADDRQVEPSALRELCKYRQVKEICRSAGAGDERSKRMGDGTARNS